MKKKLLFALIGALTFVSTLNFVNDGSLLTIADSNTSYYLCLSSDNYRQTPKRCFSYNKTDELYHLEEVTLSSAINFYVGGNDGSKWYDKNGDTYHVKDVESLSYDFLFSPNKTFDLEENGYEKTNAHFTYKIHSRENVNVTIASASGETKSEELTYNSYQSLYEVYYISSIKLNQGDTISKDGLEDEKPTIGSEGYYRIIYTPGKEQFGQTYLFDENGNYGTGAGYKYHFYIEDAPLFYLAFQEDLKVEEGIDPVTIDENKGYLLTRDESKTTAKCYSSPEFFVESEDEKLHYMAYLKEGDSFSRVGDDDDWSKTIKIADRGWNKFILTDKDSSYTLSNEEKTADYGAYYLASDINNYLYDKDGKIDLSDSYKFNEINEDENYYTKDYKQYLLTVNVPKNGISFYITNGKDKYRDGTNLITINEAGKYDILFSEDHIYGRGRHYRYSLIDEEKDTEKLYLSSVNEWNELASKCNADASYSDNKLVYLKKDIDFAGFSFTPIKNWNGAFYGSYHTLKNITLSSDANQTSVFELIGQKGSIERLMVENFKADMGDKNYVGIIGKNYGNINQLTLTSGALLGNRNIGLVAYNGRTKYQAGDAPSSTDTYQYGTISDSSNYASIRGSNNVGGIVGLNLGIVEGDLNYGNVSGYNSHSNTTTLNIGGIAGYGIGKIYDCKNFGKVFGENISIYVGGIAGLDNGECYFVRNEANISGDKYVGGIVGYYGSVSENKNDLTKYFDGTPYEDFVKKYFSTGEEQDEQYDGVKNAFAYGINLGEIVAKNHVGGMIGNVSNSSLVIKDSLSHGNITATVGDYAGGIVGEGANVTIRSSLSAGKITAKKYVGGLIGNGGNIYASFSSATIEGDDYVGGLAGYATSVISSISNTLLLCEKSAAHVGEIIGDTSSYNEATLSFGDELKNNYYVGNKGGVNGVEYKENDAAKHLEPNELASEGVLSSKLSLEFDDEYWLAGDDTKCYPSLRYFEEVEKNDDFGDEKRYELLFSSYKDELTKIAKHDSRITYLVSFMEWREEDGDLVDENGKTLYENYENTSNVRLYDGDTLVSPKLVYAKERDGKMVYEGKEGTYFVSYSLPTSVLKNTTIYATYQKATTALKSDDGAVIVNGLFLEEAKVSLVLQGNAYTIKVTVNGEEIPLSNATVKVKKSLFADHDLYFMNGTELKKIEVSEDGEYYRFIYSSNEAFVGVSNNKEAIPLWGYIVIAGVGGAAITALSFLIPSLVKKKKQKASK